MVIQTVSNNYSSTIIPTSTSAHWSSTYFGINNKTVVFQQGTLANTLIQDSGCLKFTQNGKVKLIEVVFSLSGQVGSADFGFYGDGNGSAIASGASFWYEHALKKIAPGGGFSGTTFNYYYNVEGMANGATMLINPQVKTYNGTFHTTKGGDTTDVTTAINSSIMVKLYGIA